MFTDSQIAALKWLILKSQDGTDLAKRAIWYLIDQSNGFQDEVCFSLEADREGFTGTEITKMAFAIEGMLSGNCSTHLDEILEAMVTGFSVSVHSGKFLSVPGDNPLDLTRYTFWLSRKLYSQEAKLIRVTRPGLESIDLVEPKLYRDRQLL